jgi:putative transposase
VRKSYSYKVGWLKTPEGQARSADFRAVLPEMKAADVGFSLPFGRSVCKANALVAYENLNVKGMVKNHCLAKSINDVAWSLFRRWLEYFGAKFNTTVVAVNPKYTSQQCSDCGTIVKKSLSTRTHKCSCGCELQRDVNAAINILNLAKGRDGQSRTNATGVGTSTLLGANLVEQVLTVNVESPLL